MFVPTGAGVSALWSWKGSTSLEVAAAQIAGDGGGGVARWSHSRGTYPSGTGPGGCAGGSRVPGAGVPRSVSVIGKTLPAPSGQMTRRSS